ncbi:unnamed protein product [Candida verbasci]|uniref:Peptidase S54 rhomboid domain-containing protein n=1 Tax=Candida verbasci TaxID=1227364 RepID=A0A9W4TYM4_9ASCO|nr:unnamed protein product [Candida verbasci]
MFKLFANLRMNQFYSNGNIILRNLTKQNGIKNFHSSVKPLQRFKFKPFENSPLRRSNTWKSYNQYYNRTSWDKLKNPLIFTAAFCVGTTLITPYLFEYTPLKIFRQNPQILIWSIIAINGAVFLMWKVPQFQKYTMQYGLLFKDNLQSPWTLLGSAFSHQSFTHLFINMLCFQSFASTLVMVLGVSNFTTMYLNAAVISSFASIAIPVLIGSSLSVASLGASGAIFSVFGTFSYLFPSSPVGFFFIPIPGGAWTLFLGTAAWNAAGCALRWGTFDYAAHLGGSLVGIAYGYYYSKKRKESIRRRRLAF